MNTEENDPLWRLLGEAKPPPAPSAFFSRNVLRAIRNSKEEQEKAGILSWLRGNVRFACVAGAAAIVLAFAGIRIWERPAAVVAKSEVKQEILVAQQLAKNPDSDVIKNLDELLASDDNSLWLDHSAN